MRYILLHTHKFCKKLISLIITVLVRLWLTQEALDFAGRNINEWITWRANCQSYLGPCTLHDGDIHKCLLQRSPFPSSLGHAHQEVYWVTGDNPRKVDGNDSTLILVEDRVSELWNCCEAAKQGERAPPATNLNIKNAMRGKCKLQYDIHTIIIIYVKTTQTEIHIVNGNDAHQSAEKSTRAFSTILNPVTDTTSQSYGAAHLRSKRGPQCSALLSGLAGPCFHAPAFPPLSPGGFP